MNVILIGMPGAGKSTLGVLLAKRLGYNFLDTDIVLQSKYGSLLGKILGEQGNDAFLQLEERVFLELEVENTVIATGGSAIYSDAGMQHMRQTGPAVFLDVPYSVLVARLGDLRKRGVVVPDGYTLRDLFNERRPLYSKYADITVGLNRELSLEIAANKVFERISTPQRQRIDRLTD